MISTLILTVIGCTIVGTFAALVVLDIGWWGFPIVIALAVMWATLITPLVA